MDMAMAILEGSDCGRARRHRYLELGGWRLELRAGIEHGPSAPLRSSRSWLVTSSLPIIGISRLQHRLFVKYTSFFNATQNSQNGSIW
jgi:hypothetical protein